MGPVSNYLEDKIIIEDLMKFHVVKVRPLKWFLAIFISILPMLFIVPELAENEKVLFTKIT
ncbi:MAG: hypothetical protein ACFFDN_21005 [Candidatus Hodarchaeota archaeon]